jgi:hypothetical protein
MKEVKPSEGYPFPTLIQESDNIMSLKVKFDVAYRLGRN